MRIAILTHSTNPRGGVVHALALGEALSRLGHHAAVHAPDARGTGFFRAATCATVSVPALPAPVDTAAMVRQRIGEYVAHFAQGRHRDFDAYLAGDGISGNALAILKARGLIRGFARTIHHIDDFDDLALAVMQARSIVAADRHLTVSQLWRERLHQEWGLGAQHVGNGVDLQCFSPQADGRDPDVAGRHGIDGDPVFLAVGGVEPRKNSHAILAAFLKLRALYPRAQLVIAGGATVLDHAAYRAEFDTRSAAAKLPASAIRLTGPVADAEMPALYRLADALVFPSLKEGFGLAVLEAMACGVPVVTSAIPPFTEYLSGEDALLCDPTDPDSIATAMARALEPSRRPSLSARGLAVAARHDWDRVAQAYASVFDTMSQEGLHRA